jgi:hypothetical protein
LILLRHRTDARGPDLDRSIRPDEHGGAEIIAYWGCGIVHL